jgi:C-terminal processing protease CtpA/Prc
MQAQDPAKIVGENTGGGAHGIRPYRLSAHFTASIPFSYSRNPVTDSDWEGVGIKPDVSVPADQALLRAHILALHTTARVSQSGHRHWNALSQKRNRNWLR